ncbi:MAG TPA: efflux RND transporter periplasmic adaptor subunit, partial [Candidatus Tyrphobacter sp.]
MSASSQSLTAPNAQIARALERLRALLRNRLALGGLAVLLALAIVASIVTVRAHATPTYATEPVVRQTLVQSISASGTVNPQNSVTVGSQISGTISEIDVDYNSRVRKGQVLARIDPSTLQAQLDQAQASLAQAQDQAAAQAAMAASDQAAIPAAGASVTKAQSTLALAQSTLQRDQSLLAQGYVSRAQVQTDRDGVVGAQAALETAQSQSSQASSVAAGGGASTAAAQEATAAQAAAVRQNSLNLQRSVITSPVDGTVIARDVSVGQTVAASLQTPTLFTIAQDLTKMEVDVAVGEPDIGAVRAGESVNFTVLAYPGQAFHGVVTQVRVNPTTVNNVVTYVVVTKVDNPQGKLLPGMTATATIDVASAPNALVVPLQALQYHPYGAYGRGPQAPAQTPSNASAGSPWGQAAQSSSTQIIVAGGTGMLFVDAGGRPARVPVRIDLVNGTQAAVTPLRGSLAAGDAVVIADSGGTRAHRTAVSSPA